MMRLLLEYTAWAVILVLAAGLCLRLAGNLGWLPKKWAEKLPACADGTPAIKRTPAALVRRVFVYSVGFRVFLFLVVWMYMNGGSEGVGPMDALAKMQASDSYHYIRLIEQGYAGYMENGEHLFLVFFPLYVWLTRAVCLLLPNTLAAGSLVSALCYAFGCCYLYKLAFIQYGRRMAGRAVLLLSLFPFSFFFGTVMTESLFFLTVTAACYYALQKRWVCFGIWGALAAMTRMTGLLVIVVAGVVLAAEYLKAVDTPPVKKLRERILQGLRRLPLVLMPLLGSLVYLGLNYVVDKNPFAFLIHQQHWHQKFLWAPKAIGNMAACIQSGSYDPDLTWAVWLPQIILFFLFSGVLLSAFKNHKNRTSLLLYGFCYLVGNYSLSWLLSGGRYLACGIVFFIFAAVLTERSRWVFAVVAAAEGLLLAVCVAAALNGAPIM